MVTMSTLTMKKYKAIDYDELKRKLALEEQKGEEGLSRVEGWKDLLKNKKEQTLTIQHQKIYRDEYLYLGALRRCLENEIAAIIHQHGTESGNVFSDINDFQSNLEQDLTTFRDLIMSDVLAFRKIMSGNSIKDMATTDLLFDSTIQTHIHKINKTLEDIVVKKICLEAELNITGLVDGLQDEGLEVETGIPEEAFDFQCPDVSVKSSVLEQFIFLDSDYFERLNECQEKLREVSKDCRAGWSAKDHDVFVTVRDAYNRKQTQNSHSLFVDNLTKLLPHKSRREIVTHEAWYEECLSLVRQREKVANRWTKDRAELLNRAEILFEDLRSTRIQQKNKKEEFEAQRKKAEEIHAKIDEWRKQKAKLFEMQSHAENEMLKKVAEENDEKIRIKSSENKIKIKHYHEILERSKLQKEHEMKERRKVLEQQLEQQAVRDKERVEFRKMKQLENSKKKTDDEERKKLQSKEKEEILEAIRMKVRPHVERDLMRLWEETKAWKEKQKKSSNNIQNIFASLKTFTAEQVMSDPRFRLEQRLREAGLIDNSYAKKIMSKIQPNRPPRKDMLSTLTFNND